MNIYLVEESCNFDETYLAEAVVIAADENSALLGAVEVAEEFGVNVQIKTLVVTDLGKWNGAKFLSLSPTCKVVTLRIVEEED